MATRNLGDDAAELVTACRAFASLMGQQIEGQMVVDVCRSTVHAMMVCRGCRPLCMRSWVGGRGWGADSNSHAYKHAHTHRRVRLPLVL